MLSDEDEQEQERFDFRSSFWAARETESDSKDFYDTEDVFRRRLGVDWKRCIAKERFKDVIMKEDNRAREEKERTDVLAAEGKQWDAEAIGGRNESLWQRTKNHIMDKQGVEGDLLYQEKANPSLLDHLGAKELTLMKKLLAGPI